MPTTPVEVDPDTLPSVLYRPVAVTGHDAPGREEIDDDAWHDLALDQFEAALAQRVGERLASVLRRPLGSTASVRWRQEVFRDLHEPAIHDVVTTFRKGAREARTLQQDAKRSHDRYIAALGHLRATGRYLRAELELARSLPPALHDKGHDEGRLHDEASPSAALSAIAAYLERNVDTRERATLREHVEHLATGVAGVQSTLWIEGATIHVGAYDDEPNDVTPVLDTFARFRTGNVDAPEMDVPRDTLLDHVQESVLDLVAGVHPDVFDPVVDFARDTPDAIDPVVALFDDEIRFYLAIDEMLAPLADDGLPVCLPEITEDDQGVHANGLYDVVLARALAENGTPTVPNDLHLEPAERLVVITGPNQGGKTTMARTIGQLHHLAATGCPVAASSALVPLTGRVLTHLDRPERLDNLQGRLGEDLTRLRDLLKTAGPDTLVVLNEAFASTTLADATYLNREILTRLRRTGARGVCVTFIEELATFDDATVSLVAEIDPDAPAARTFHLTRRPADGRAYALALAEKHRLTPQAITARITENNPTAPHSPPDGDQCDDAQQRQEQL